MVLAKTQADVGRMARRLLDRDLSRVAKRSADAVASAGELLAIEPGTRLLSAARKLIATVTDNAYAHAPEIAPEKGLFHGDCSDLINYLLGKVDPKALRTIPVDARTGAPRSRTYHAFLTDLPEVGGANPTSMWARVPRPGELRSGDVLAWKNAAYKPGVGSTGHMMLVAEAPIPVHRDGRLLGFDVPIVDSTSHGHGVADPRVKGGLTGLGEGTVFFPVDDQGLATGFSWTRAAESIEIRSPDLAFGRLRN